MTEEPKGDLGEGHHPTERHLPAALALLLPPEKALGRPPKHDVEAMMDALRHKLRTGCSWRQLPPPPRLPPWQTVYAYQRQLVRFGMWPAIRHHLLKPPSDPASPRPAGRYDNLQTEVENTIRKSQAIRAQARAVADDCSLRLALSKKYSQRAAERLRQLRDVLK